MPVRARLVFPGVPPVDRAQHDRRRPARDRVIGGGSRERGADVAAAQAAKREVAGAEVIEARLEARDRADRDVHLGLVERARRGRGAEEHLAAARVGLLLRHAGGVVEHRRQLAQAERRGRRRRLGERGERIDPQRVELARKRNRR